MGFFFNKKGGEETISARRNWYADRYQSALVQRNFLALVTIVSLAAVIVSVITVIKVSSSKTIEPFVIEIEDKTGITSVIRPLAVEKFAYDEMIQRYFIMKYINARETYDAYSYEYNYYTVVKLLSDNRVYADFRRQVANANSGTSPLSLGQFGNITVKVKSIAFLTTNQNTTSPKDKKAVKVPSFTAQIRFTSSRIMLNSASSGAPKNKIATMNFVFGRDVKLTAEERYVNPLGFFVTSYRLDDEVL